MTHDATAHIPRQLDFDYDALDDDTRAVVQQKTSEIRSLMRRAAQDIVGIGLKLIEVKDRLGHGRFGGWLEAEFAWSDQTALNFMSVARRFPQIPNRLEFAPRALYLLSAPSTPDSARVEAIDRASMGEPITLATAREIVASSKAADSDTPAPRSAREARESRRLDSLNGMADAPEPDGETSWRILTGDVLDRLATLPDACARLIFADPPYNIGIDYGDGGKADRLEPAEYVEWAGRWVAECARLLTADGSLWVLINHEYAAHHALALERAGLHLRNWITWYETFGVNCVNMFNRTSRPLLYFCKSPDDRVFNRSAVTRPSDRQTKYNDARANPEGKILDDVWTDIPRLAGTHAERIPSFPTQLPVALLQRIVACASEPGDLVIDPFNGSGTTGAACIRLGRRYIGVERQPRFVELATLRLRGETYGSEPQN